MLQAILSICQSLIKAKNSTLLYQKFIEAKRCDCNFEMFQFLFYFITKKTHLTQNMTKVQKYLHFLELFLEFKNISFLAIPNGIKKLI